MSPDEIDTVYVSGDGGKDPEPFLDGFEYVPLNEEVSSPASVYVNSHGQVAIDTDREGPSSQQMEELLEYDVPAELGGRKAAGRYAGEGKATRPLEFNQEFLRAAVEEASDGTRTIDEDGIYRAAKEGAEILE